MMMLNKDKKFEYFNLKSSRGNEDSVEEKSKRIEYTNPEFFGFKQTWKILKKIEKYFPFI